MVEIIPSVPIGSQRDGLSKPEIRCQSDFGLKRNRSEPRLTISIALVKTDRRSSLKIDSSKIFKVTTSNHSTEMPSLSSQFNTMSATSDWLYGQILNNASTVLLLDCRPFNEYSQNHIHSAVNLAVPLLMLRRLKKGCSVNFANMVSTEEGKRRFAKRDLMDKIVIYDSSTDNLTNTALELIIQRFSSEGLDNVFYLKGGFATFKNDYPNLCESEEVDQVGPSYIRLSDLRISSDETSPLKSCAPSSPYAGESTKVKKGAVEILPNLYLGNARDASDLMELLDRNITCILNVTNDIPNKFENDPRFKYMNLRVQDNWQTNLAEHFQEAFKFIDEARLNGKAVLVHCLAGISRSVTVTTAYLMEHEHLSLNDAYDLVKGRKSDISPNFSFMGQLLEFERRLNIPATPSSASSSLSSTSSLEMEISAF